MDNIIAVELLTGWFALGFIAALIYLTSPDRKYKLRWYRFIILALITGVCITFLGVIGVVIVLVGERKHLTTPEES